MKGRQIFVTIFDDSDGRRADTAKKFEGDELTSSEQQAILWLREQEGDPLDEIIDKQVG